MNTITANWDEVYIVGGGQSLKNFDWSLLSDKIVIAINDSYKVLPSACIVYFTDLPWWNKNKHELLDHSALLCHGTLHKPEIKHPKVVEWELVGESGLSDKTLKLCHGRNSTYAALNMAVQMKFTNINLLGIDMKGQHWHDNVLRPTSDKAYQRMIKNFNAVAPELKARNINIVNINDDSALKCFPTSTIGDFFGK